MNSKLLFIKVLNCSNEVAVTNVLAICFIFSQLMENEWWYELILAWICKYVLEWPHVQVAEVVGVSLTFSKDCISEIVYGDQTAQQNSKIGLTKVVYNLALTDIGQQLKLRWRKALTEFAFLIIWEIYDLTVTNVYQLLLQDILHGLLSECNNYIFCM